ncbi:hypothetical protein [Aquamicrobium soli]|jgi:predicted MFS family arabinose efflux permease|uniref:MFS transporter n=1 Tax=Aquamicrobium soli TaxID=1811518 RepID=A0ABV7K3K2_9HYPH
MRLALCALTTGTLGIGVTLRAPIRTAALTVRWPRKYVLLSLMVLFVIANAACALAPSYEWLTADGKLIRAIAGTLAALAAVLGLMTFALDNQIAAIVFTGLLGAAGFATVAPLQMWVLSKAEGAGQSLASSFNIGAFNLGNAIGAWAGGVVIDQGPGLAVVPITAALFPLLAIVTALIAVRASKGATLTPSCNPVH